MKTRMKKKKGHIGSKTRSLGKMLEKHYVCSRCHVFNPKIMKLDQYVCLDEISDKFENGSCGIENYVRRSNLRKTLCTL